MAEQHKHHADDLAHRLIALSHNLWWAWNPEAQQVFKELAPIVWRYSNHNAVEVLKEVSLQELTSRLRDKYLSTKVAHVVEEFESYMNERSTWSRKNYPNLKEPVAYFSAEFGLHESLPIYSGGLGILSGDHMKSASDLGLPFVGVGLFYRHGYFQQRLGPDGWQQELYPMNDPERLPLKLVEQREGGRLLNSVEIGHSTVYFQTWEVRVGRVVLYLLDTNLPENDQLFQDLTGHVYGGNLDTRIGQEIILGIGGARLLRSLGIRPSVYHMNEGHSAFLVLELLAQGIRGGLSRADAEQGVRELCMFTTHTPVPAGHDRFSPELMLHSLGNFWAETGLMQEDLMSYGRVVPSDVNEHFTMTVLALKMSRAANGVSKLHGAVSREMWKDLYPGRKVDAVPIGHVTNGIHTPSWANGTAHQFWNSRLGYDWTEKLMQPKFWKKMQDGDLATDEELWALRSTLRRNLVEFARRRLYGQHMRVGSEDASRLARVLSSDALTIGFARRFATYKRAPLLFRHLDQVVPLLTDAQHPVQLIFAGKAHPRDNEGKKFIQHIFEITRNPQLYGRVVLIENYDMNVARHLVSGSDVWLNTPRRPLEASGTSGQKIAIYGGLNLSIMDGWWPEGFNSSNGWAIGNGEEEGDPDKQDEKDFQNLLRVLREDVIPDFYERDSLGIPRRWMQRMRNAMHHLIPAYSTDRMVAEYVAKYYSAS
ncbi:MAG TPA: alpha-glucan family phosphorylase [Bacteroidota bacterium]|nr:alpha-glucan family phosphorylase [Bacteroidota bacterium]